MLSINEVKHVAQLARLGISEVEAAEYQGELSAVLNYIDQLKEVKVDGVDPTAQVTGLTNRLREDIVAPWDKAEAAVALSQAEIEDGLVRVPKIL